MTKAQQEAIVKILDQSKGDDLWRAMCAFKGCDLTQTYGESGRTRQAILDGYQAHEDAVNALIEAVKGIQCPS